MNILSLSKQKWCTAIFLSCICFSPFETIYGFTLTQTEQNELAKPATIKVLLEESVDGALVEMKGPYTVIDQKTGKKLSSGSFGKRFYVFPLSDGIKWGEEFPGHFQIRIEPTSSDTTLLVNGIQLRGALEIYSVDYRLNIINEVDVETYLKCTLHGKLPESTPPAVRDAVAIIARTDAYYKALANFDSYYHVVAKDVGYFSYTDVFNDPKIDQSIDNTRHLVMTYDSQPFAATWTKNSAGRTASFDTIFRKATSAPQGVKVEVAQKKRNESKWNFSEGVKELSAQLGLNTISQIELFVDHKSQKVYGIRVKDGTHLRDFDFITLQKVLGGNKLKSSDFTAKLQGNQVVFEGFGEGSGVGLCLFSASHMAEAGESAPKILADFFPYTYLEKMRSYPEMIISPSKEYFISPKKKRSHKIEG